MSSGVCGLLMAMLFLMTKSPGMKPHLSVRIMMVTVFEVQVAVDPAFGVQEVVEVHYSLKADDYSLYVGQCSVSVGQSSISDGQCSLSDGRCSLSHGQCSLCDGRCTRPATLCGLRPLV